jgi:hypothetical protein
MLWESRQCQTLEFLLHSISLDRAKVALPIHVIVVSNILLLILVGIIQLYLIEQKRALPRIWMTVECYHFVRVWILLSSCSSLAAC